MKLTSVGTLMVAVLMLQQSALGQFLMIPDSSADSIGLYSPVDGSLIDANFIVDANNDETYNFSTPKEAIQVGNEIWVSDQIEDAVFIFDLAGNYLTKIGQDTMGNATGVFDNNRGLAFANGTVYVSNSGSSNGAPGDAIVTVDPATKMATGNFVVTDPTTGDVTDPFDVALYEGDLLITDINAGTNGDGIDLVALDGSYISRLVSSDGVDGIDFPQQASAKQSDSNFVVAGFSPPDGLYEYDSMGTELAYFPGTAQRGVFELQNGNYLYTGGAGTFVLDPATGGTMMVGAGSQYISPLTIPEPRGAWLALGMSAVLLTRRRFTRS
ncbi:MAG: hypothetical protein AAGF97_10460 [Planctomycetota bacterium]